MEFCNPVCLYVLAIGLATVAPGASAATTLCLELSNDVIVGSDNQFTNGISVRVSSKAVRSLDKTAGTPAFGKSVLTWAIPDQPGLNYRESWVFAQNMETPADIAQPALIENDVPYIGFLGWGNSFYGFDNEHFFGAQWLFGWVGEEALAEPTQKTFHALIGGDDPKGWDNQLDFEPLLNGYLGIKRRFYQNAWSDVALSGDLAVGNIMTYAQSGLEFRFGDRPQGFHFIAEPVGRGMDYNATLQPSEGAHFYASAALRATYFVWSLPFEGNLFVDNEWTDRNTIDINRAVGQAIFGLHWVGPRFGAHLSLRLSTATVDENSLPPSEDPRNSFGSFMVEYRL